ncbi:MAG: gliding motility lipoprotein GldH [Prevotella sp.]|nr:gliding motility lipoprotein GldH [Prevotella sp.]
MNRKRNSLPSILLAAALALAGCSRLPLYSHFEAVADTGWSRTDTLRFTIPTNQAGTYNLRLDLRASSLYPYTQLTLFACRQTSHAPAAAIRDTLVFDITDNDGNIQGSGTSVYQYSTRLSSVHLGKRDTLTITLFHAMARDVLPGIVDLGITMQESD